MSKRKLISILAVGMLSIVAVMGAMTIQSVSAQATTPTAEPETQTPSDDVVPPSDEIRGRVRLGLTQEDLAAALGIDVETLQAAHETAMTQALEQAVSAGLITQEQADNLSARGFAGRHGFGKGILEANGIDYDALLAEALNISVEQLEAARTQAFTTSVDNAVAEGTITQEQADLIKGQTALFADENFQNSMQTAFEAAVQQAVSDGVITQAQSDRILEAQSQRGGFFGRGGLGGHGFGGPGFGRHGRGGGMHIMPELPDEIPPVEGTDFDL